MARRGRSSVTNVRVGRHSAIYWNDDDLFHNVISRPLQDLGRADFIIPAEDIPEDRRRFPSRVLSPRTYYGTSSPIRFDNYNNRFYFGNPLATLVCVRRKARKEVMHATGRAGRRYRFRRRSQWSDVRC